MASMMMASMDTPESSSMATMKMPTGRVSPELSIPYAFRSRGLIASSYNSSVPAAWKPHHHSMHTMHTCSSGTSHDGQARDESRG